MRLHLCHVEGNTRGTTGILLSLLIICIYFSVKGGKFAANPSGYCKCFINQRFFHEIVLEIRGRGKPLRDAVRIIPARFVQEIFLLSQRPENLTVSVPLFVCFQKQKKVKRGNAQQ